MKPGDLVQANKFANWSVQQAKIGLVLEVTHHVSTTGGVIRVLLCGDTKVLPACHFEVINASR